jgi:RNA polymerase sigma-54 factor
MSLGFRLELRQSQGLVLTPQLQQAIKLLQLSNLELRGAVDREVAENPFLERREPQLTAKAPPPVGERALDGQPEMRPVAGAQEALPEPPPMGADHRLGLRQTASRSFEDLPSVEDRLTRPRGLRQAVAEQVRMSVDAGPLQSLALALVEEIEDDGYLREADSELALRYGCAERLVGEARSLIQRCEPAGIGARDLAECLRLQLIERDRLDPAMRLLVDNLPLLARADLASLMRLCGVDAEDLHEMIAELKALNPRPGSTYFTDPVEIAVPDVIVYALGDGRWRIELNSGTLPRVLVDTAYYAELSSRRLERREREYLTERMQSATWLAKALDQRARTVLRVAKAIFARQQGFLSGGVGELRPLILRNIAEATGLHESTVSRATADKYAHTPWGTFPLKYFFTTAIAGTSGEESHSAEAIRQQIKRMVDREVADSVLSDDQIVAELERSGVVIARRTVAKYREALGIASSVQRRRLKVLGR